MKEWIKRLSAFLQTGNRLFDDLGDQDWGSKEIVREVRYLRDALEEALEDLEGFIELLESLGE